MPPKSKNAVQNAPSGGNSFNGSIRQKNQDSQILQAFLLSQSSQIDPNSNPDAKLAQVQELVLNEQGWKNFEFLRETSMFNTALFGRPDMEGDTKRLVDVVESTMNVMQTYYIMKLTPTEYYNHPLAKVSCFFKDCVLEF